MRELAAPQSAQIERVMAGGGQGAASERRKTFIQAYLANGHNATQAAITAGYSPKTAYSQGQRLLKGVEKSGELALAARTVATASGLTAERSLQEVARIAFSDIRRAFNADGSLKAAADMDDGTAAAVGSMEVVTRGEGNKQRVVTKIKFWDKNAALDHAMRHQGLYERDNTRAGERITVELVLVGSS